MTAIDFDTELEDQLRFLRFRDSEAEAQFTDEYILKRFSHGGLKKIRVILLICVPLQYLAFSAIQFLQFYGYFSDERTPQTLIPLDAFISTAALVFLVSMFRVLTLLDKIPKFKLSGSQTELLDQIVFLTGMITLGLKSGYEQHHDSNYFFIAIIEGPIVAPARVCGLLVVIPMSIVLYCGSIAGLGNPTSYELLVTIATCVLVAAFQIVGFIQLELKSRKKFLLEMQTKEYYEEKVRLTEECLKQEQEVGRAKNRLVSIISHELRTPVQGISSMSSLLLDSNVLQPADRECAAIIKRSSDLLVSIINDFLDMSRLDSDQISFKKEDVDLIEAAEDTLEMVSQSVYKDGKKLEAVYSIEPSVSQRVISDRQRVKQMLLNLTANAVKFCQSGRIKISFSISSPHLLGSPFSVSFHTPRSSPDPDISRTLSSGQLQVPTFTVTSLNDISQPMLCISVSDTGIGLVQEHLPRVFQEFFMVEDGPKRPKGTGLGLAIVKRTAVGMGGTVQVSSPGPGQGSTFRIFLPYIPAPLAYRSTPPQPGHTQPSLTIMPSSAFFNDQHSFEKKSAYVFAVNSDDVARECLLMMLPPTVQTLGFSSISRLSSFLLDQFSKFEMSHHAPDMDSSVIILIDCNALEPDSTNLRFLFAQSKNLETPKLHFAFVLVSPLHDGLDDLAVLHSLGFLSKIPKPTRKNKLAMEIERIMSLNLEIAHPDRPTPTPSTRRKSIIISLAAWVGSYMGNPQEDLPHVSPLTDVAMIPTPASSQPPQDSGFGRVGSERTMLGLHGRTGSFGSVAWDVSNGNAGKIQGPPAVDDSLLIGLEKPHILIVEDNKVIQRAFVRMLHEVFSCDIANNGQEALEMLDESYYDCILMDFHMDVMDGMTATQLIRKRTDAKKDVPIIGLSGEASDEARKMALDVGMSMCLVKPVQKSDLFSAIESMISGANLGF